MRAKSKKQKGPYKSGLEKKFAELCFKHGVKAKYEAKTFEFTKIAHYKPDWEINPNLYVETKGYFSPSNRGNLLSFREQHPNVEIFLVFSEPNNRLSSKSKTTYGEWATRHNFGWAGINDFQKVIEKCQKDSPENVIDVSKKNS